jgi:uncharacterized membrane protein YkvI
MRQPSKGIRRQARRLGIVLLAEVLLLSIPFMVNATENAWHWVDDQGPSFLAYLALSYGALALMVVVPIIYVLSLFIHPSCDPDVPSRP